MNDDASLSVTERSADQPAISSLLTTYAALAGSRDLDALCDRVLASLEWQFGAQACSILILARPMKRARFGVYPPSAQALVKQWEDALEGKLLQGAWNLPASGTINPTIRELPEGSGVLVNTPLVQGQRVVGSLNACFASEAMPDPDNRRLLGRMGALIGQLAMLLGELNATRQQLKHLSLYYSMSHTLVSSFDLSRLLEDTMQLATDMIGAGAASLMLIDAEHGDLVFEVTQGERGDLLHSQRIPIDKGVAGWVARTGEPCISNNVRADPRFNPAVDAHTGFLTHNILAVPLKIKGRILGVLEVLNKYSGEGFNEDDLALLSAIAAQAAIALENARLYQSVREERDRIIQAQEDVRKELARNLHDGTVQTLSAISMSLDLLERFMADSPDTARTELSSVRQLVHRATREARLALFELRPIILETEGLAKTLRRYADQLKETEHLPIHFEAEPIGRAVPTNVATTIFAIVQEAINNAKKHANAGNIWLRLTMEDGNLSVAVQDDGRGFDVEQVRRTYSERGSFGLLTMSERAELIEGKLSIASAMEGPQKGTLIKLEVPLTPEGEPGGTRQGRES